MSGPLYGPVLSARPYATAAYRDLAPDVRRRITPLWTPPPHPGVPPGPLAGRIA
ncbi:hypothetical protein AB0E75_23205 [Streptomyces griseoviridis]|uniref:Uncharacterized protein n=1 Tax=Streptomyces griseoviridis TaxID=45398 RepID=A0A918GLS7_STRGD|nr:hypothetical protein [Streptomyces niveoruber]GGS45248.1 hypothetical protein GCM10010238_38910 [Streptomyces niveoruber]